MGLTPPFDFVHACVHILFVTLYMCVCNLDKGVEVHLCNLVL